MFIVKINVRNAKNYFKKNKKSIIIQLCVYVMTKKKMIESGILAHIVKNARGGGTSSQVGV